jgi:hypothetical protein
MQLWICEANNCNERKKLNDLKKLKSKLTPQTVKVEVTKCLGDFIKLV